MNSGKRHQLQQKIDIFKKNQDNSRKGLLPTLGRNAKSMQSMLNKQFSFSLEKLQDKAKQLVSGEDLREMQNRKLNEQMLANNKAISKKISDTKQILNRLRKNVIHADSSSSTDGEFDKLLDRGHMIHSQSHNRLIIKAIEKKVKRKQKKAATLP